VENKDFKIDVMLCFWFAIHKECMLEAQLIYTQDPIISKILKILREKGESDLILKRKKDQEKR